MTNALVRRSLRPLAALAVSLVTASASATAQPPAVVTEAPVAGVDGVEFHARLDHDTVYVGQQVTYQVAVFLDDVTRLRLRRNPEFVPAEPRGMLAYDLHGTGGPVGTRTVHGRRYEAHVFERAFFPLAPGRYTIPPAELTYSLPLSASFFSREERRTLRTESLTIVAVAPPESARPADWSGAVGDVAVSAATDTLGARVGDPLVVTLRVTGAGNVKLFPRPPLALAWGTAVPADERVRLDTLSPVVRGTKEFDFIVTPTRSGRAELPSERYPFFNPFTERYEIAVAPAVPVAVGAGSLVVMDTARAGAPPALSLRATYRGELPRPLPSRPSFWAFVLLTPLPAAGIGVARRAFRARVVPPAVRLRALARRGDGSAALVRQVYAAALADRIGLPAVTLTSAPALSRALRRSGVTRATAAAAASHLAALDDAAYARDGALPQEARRLAHRLALLVDREARPRAPRRVVALVGAIALALAAGRAAAAVADDGSAAFASGVAAYAARDYATASRDFRELASARPAAADAWANYGTAAWASADTAGAVEGWQRALRLEPLAPDARERLTIVAGEPSGAAAVPAIPLGPVAALAALCWAAAWTIVALRAKRRASGASLAAYASFVACVVAAAASALAASTLAASDVAVVRGTSDLRTPPALSAERASTAAAGEVIRTDQRVSAWTHVALDDGRDGWVETARLLPLASR